MKEAYCAIPADRTVRFLEENMEENEDCLEVVESVQTTRVCETKVLKSAENITVSRLILRLPFLIRVFVEKILMRNTRNESFESFQAYMKEAWMIVGSSFIELAGDEVERLPCINFVAIKGIICSIVG
ncbi:hypothetical protein BVRB_7g172850 [Beta vulgaris subsp. vulgaris]|nr:hypothetical protein BVRB_7g172850 [Beta vulgaris subsp. vulgaris]